MLNLKVVAIAAALTFAGAGAALAEQSAIDALSSATTIGIVTVTGPDAINVMPGGVNGELVDLDSVKARIQANPKLLGQLESYGATIDDVVGITGSSETDVTIYVQG